MAIKVTGSHDPYKIQSICLTIYSNPGLGKTSLAFTASRPLLLDFDGGAYRADNRGDTVIVSDWSDVAGIERGDVESYDTIIIDTVGKALESLTQDILRRNSRLGWGGALNQQGWGQLGVQFRSFMSKIKGFGKDVVLISHMDEQRDGDQTRERLKIPGATQGLVLTDSDSIGRISIVDQRRYLIFNPTEASFGKDPARLGVAPIPESESEQFDNYLARGIAKIKERLNEARVPDKGERDWFAQHLPECKDADAVNALSARAHKAGRDVEGMVAQRASELGLEYDAQRREYIYLEEMDQKLEEERAEKGVA